MVDSTVALFWINGSGIFKQFVENRVQKFHAQPEITWKHVPTQQNPTDLASRDHGDVKFRELWGHGPEWMSDSKCWPVQQVNASEESREEIKVQKRGICSCSGYL